jgi:xylan 1,4-beta-xylosidase
MSVATNPILAGFFPDPSICRVGEAFYLVNSTFEFFPGLPVHRSTDLVHWELVGHVIDRDGQFDLASAAASGGLYAPTIRHHGGRFWIACTLVGQAGGHFLIIAQDAAGPWGDPVWIRGTRGIDPTIFFEDNDMWIAGCRLVDPGEYQGQTEIWLSRVDPASGRLLGPEHVLWTGAVRGAVWSEGPHLYRIGQWYYLLTTEGGTEQNHCVVVARSRNLTGPYEGCPRNPVFSHRTLGSTAHRPSGRMNSE